jgi:hypothetical protein
VVKKASVCQRPLKIASLQDSLTQLVAPLRCASFLVPHQLAPTIAMIVASSCLFAVLASFAQANNIRSNPLAATAAAAKAKANIASAELHPRQVAAKIAQAKTGFALGHFPDNAALKNFRVVEQGENSLNPLATASFFTQSYRDGVTCDSTKPTVSTFGYLTETCFTPTASSGVTFTSFAYRCNTSKFCCASLFSTSQRTDSFIPTFLPFPQLDTTT